MEPHRRDEQEEEILGGMIRGGTADVTHIYLNESGEGDESLIWRDEFTEEEVEGEADGEADGSDDGEADGSGETENIRNSGEVHIYIN